MSCAAAERLALAAEAVGRADLHRRRGRVTELIGLIVEATGLEAEVGEVCEISLSRNARTGERPPLPAEVVGFRAGRTLLMPLGEIQGIAPGDAVTATGRQLSVPIGDALLGRVLDGLGRPIDGGGALDGLPQRPVTGSPPSPLERPRITDRVTLGVRALDALVPCGRGQRLGIFAGSGVGKSSLLGMIARSTSADVNVICLVGERGREVASSSSATSARPRARSVVVVRDLRPARAGAHQGRAHRDRDRRALPRPRQRRHADDGLGDALRDGPARGRPGDRRAARHARLHAAASSRCCPSSSSGRARARTARSPASTPCSSTATT